MKTTGNASASTSKTGGRLTGKDLINVGIFTAIYFVVVFAVACLGFIPILMAAICGIIPLIAGIPYMLFNMSRTLSRAKVGQAPRISELGLISSPDLRSRQVVSNRRSYSQFNIRGLSALS